MANRYQQNQYNLAYKMIAERDGEYCLACFIETGQRRGPQSVRIEIDHADSDPFNWDPQNVHFLCKTHNIKFRSLSVQQHVSRMATYSAENVRVRMRTGEYLSSTKLLGVYETGSPEMKINSIAERKWLEFMHEWLDVNGSIAKEDAVNAGAIAADDVNIQTTQRYYIKHTSVLGRFKEIKQNGIKYVIFRDELPGKKGKGAGNG
jgi:hypothetical protein